MVKLKKKVTLLFLFTLLFGFANGQSFTGTWMTACGGSYIKVYEDDNGLYQGTIVWIRDKDPEEQKLLGTMILNDFKMSKKNFKGTVYDPTKKNSYKCTITIKGEDTLDLRGYVGIPLLGRTEKWIRVKRE